MTISKARGHSNSRNTSRYYVSIQVTSDASEPKQECAYRDTTSHYYITYVVSTSWTEYIDLTSAFRSQFNITLFILYYTLNHLDFFNNVNAIPYSSFLSILALEF